MSHGCLKPADERCIQSNYCYLKAELDAVDIAMYLHQEGVLSLDDKEKINAGITKDKRNEVLLNILLHAGPGESFNIFLKSLDKNHTHVKDRLLKHQPKATTFPLGRISEMEISKGNFKNIFSAKKALLGYGNFGVVYLAETQKQFPSFCAVREMKLVVPAIKKKELTEKIDVEVQKMTELNHERLARLYGSFSDNSSVFIFSEYIQCGSLHDRIVKYGSLVVKTVEKITFQILEALAYLHSKNIVHRDLKSSNILMTYDESIKLSDYGISAILEEIAPTVITTSRYTAPEILHSDHYDYPADIWSLGCVVLEMITGRHPFPHLTGPRFISVLLSSNPSPIQFCLAKELSDKEENFLKHIFQEDPNKRPTAENLKSDSFLGRPYPMCNQKASGQH